MQDAQPLDAPARRSRWLRALALTSVMACGPEGGAASEGGSGGSTGGATNTATASVDTSGGPSASSGSSGADTSTGADVECVDNVANAPWCYRRFTVEASPQKGVFGRMGPNGEPRFFFPKGSGSGPMLVGWDGEALVVEEQAFPEESYDAHTWIAASPRENSRDDLLGLGNGPTGSFLNEFTLFGSEADGFGQGQLTAFPEAEARGPHCAADVDGDAIDEIVVTDSPTDPELYSGMRVLKWNGTTLEFVGGRIHYNLDYCGYPISVEALHVDGDPFEDVMLATDCDQRLNEPFLYLVRGAEEIAQMELQVTAVPIETAGHDMHIADLDGDGVNDVVLPRPSSLSVLVGEGESSFGPEVVVWTDEIPLAVEGDIRYPDWQLADLDGDGAMELLAGRTALVDAARNPNFVEFLPAGQVDPITFFVAVGDISGDGIDDLAMNTVPFAEILVSGPPDH